MKEFCTDTLTFIPQAIQNGCDRIELCSHLDVGGLSPYEETFLEARAISQKKGIKLMTMIRVTPGSFCYSDETIEAMIEALTWYRLHHTDGVVFGCLTPENTLDIKNIKRLVDAAQSLDITFHMAFDEIPIDEQKNAIRQLSELGIYRILTHGGAMDRPIEEHLDHLKSLALYAQKYGVTIMPGGGVTKDNLEALQSVIPTSEWHGTKIVGTFSS